MAVIMHEKFLCRMIAAPDAYNLTKGMPVIKSPKPFAKLLF